MLEVGAAAPDFTLRDQDGEKVALAELRGNKVLLVFYPLDFSPVCTDQLSVYQEVRPEIEEKGVRMFGVSVDSSYAHKAFQAQLGIEIPLLSDFEPKGEVSRAYDAYVPAFGTSSRTLVLIDEEGLVEWVHEGAVGEVPGANLIFDALA